MFVAGCKPAGPVCMPDMQTDAHPAQPLEHGQREDARLAVAAARRFGGIVEHPAHSRLWDDQGLPQPGAAPDASGGCTLPIDQGWSGHHAPKATWLYIVGIQPHELPRMPFEWPAAGRVTHLGHAERERTPAALAAWLIEAAQIIRARP